MSLKAHPTVDMALLMQRIVLLHMLTEIQQGHFTDSHEPIAVPSDNSFGRVLNVVQEKELVEAFTFTASITDDPRKVIAVSIEEDKAARRITVRLAANHGGLVTVQRGLQGIASILERVARREIESSDETRRTLFRHMVALNQDRILTRLKSRHAVLKCNFKKKKQAKPKVIPQLSKAMNGMDVAALPVVKASHILLSDVAKLNNLFLVLEKMTAVEARAEKGLRVLLEIVMTSHYIHSRHTLHTALNRTTALEPDLKIKIITTLSKLSRYWTVSKYLLGAARKYPLFAVVEISTVQMKAEIPPRKDPDQFTTQIIKRVCTEQRWKRTLAKVHLESEPQVRTYVSCEASSDTPVHAEVQLLLHYANAPYKWRPRIIGSSKKACFLCNLMFTLYGGFMKPATHGKIYPKWGLPRIDTKNFSTERICAALQEFFNSVQTTLQYQLSAIKRRMPAPFESAIFPSAACSYTNLSMSTKSCSTEKATKPHVQSKDCTSSLASLPQPEESVDVIRVVDVDDNDQEQCSSGLYAGVSDSKLMHRLYDNIADSPTIYRSFGSQLELRSESHPTILQGIVSAVMERDKEQRFRILERGERFCTQLRSADQPFTVNAPELQVILACGDDLTTPLSARRSSEDRDPITQYQVALEWLDGPRAHLDQFVSMADVADMDVGSEMTIDLGEAGWPRVLYIRSADDVISIAYCPASPLPS